MTRIVLGLILALQYPIPGVPVGGGNPSQETPSVPPTITFDAPCVETICTFSNLTQNLGGTITAGSGAITGASLTCSGATTIGPVSVAGAGETTWARLAQVFAVGTTACVVTVTDANARTAAVGKSLVGINPDTQNPTVEVQGSCASGCATTATSIVVPVNCTDDVACVTMTWSRSPTANGQCDAVSLQTLTTQFNCDLPLVATGGLTTVNAFTFFGFDQQAKSGTDTSNITRTVNITVTGVFNPCSVNVSCTVYLDAAGGNGTYTFSKLTGSYLTSNPAFSLTTTGNRGVITGTCTVIGETQDLTFRATDGLAATGDSTTLTMRCIDPTAQTYFQQIGALTEAQAITVCANNGDAKGCSLSTLAQLTALTQNGVTMHTIDSSTFGMNVAKLTWPQTVPSGPESGNSLRMRAIENEGRSLFIWDTYYDASFGPETCGGPGRSPNGYQHKEFQIEFDDHATADGPISLEIQTQLGKKNWSTCDDWGGYGIRLYTSTPQSNSQLAYNETENLNAGSDKSAGEGTFAPARERPVPWGQWIRHWLEVVYNQSEAAFTSWNTKYGITVPTGTYHMVSYWIAGPGFGPIRLAYKFPLRIGYSSTHTTVTTLTCSGTTATLTASGSLPWANTNETIYISGGNEANHKGVFQILTKQTSGSPSTTTLTYTNASCPGSGTGTYKVGSARTWSNAFWWEHDTSSTNPEATGFVTVTGTDGTVIANGLTLKRSDNEKFITQQPPGCSGATCRTIAGGTVQIYVQAKNGGPDGNTAAATVLNFDPLVAGVTSSVVGAGGLTGGRYVTSGDLIMYQRWYSWLKNYTLPATPEDDTVIFQRPQ